MDCGLDLLVVELSGWVCLGLVWILLLVLLGLACWVCLFSLLLVVGYVDFVVVVGLLGSLHGDALGRLVCVGCPL